MLAKIPRESLDKGVAVTDANWDPWAVIPPRYNLGVALTELESYTEAELHFRRALELRPAEPVVLLRLAFVLAQQSKCAEALQAAESVLAADPDSADAHILVARELAHFGRNAEAKAALERALALKPDILDTWKDVEELWESLQSI